jgi:2-keto-4-pentenoate hydratase/2-oxohepta-3-ene-1,7-dioic acid hydratase in catechol pathway
MRFATVQLGGRAHLGLVDGEQVFLFAPLARQVARPKARGAQRGVRADVPDDLLSFIQRGALGQARRALALGRRLHREGKTRDIALPLGKAKLLAPIPRPTKNIFCLGRNYAEHARERGNPVPTVPIYFTKAPTSVVGPEAPVIHHAVTRQLDYEVELAVIVGKRGRDIAPERALDHVFGYTIINDISARDLQQQHGQYFKGKSLDTFAPMGPVVVHRSLIPNPQALTMRLRVNGEQRQYASTGSMVFPIADLLSTLSAGLTLEPGDIIATGTPEGVAMGMTPQRWLKAGDVVEAEIEGIGVLRNRIVAP